MHHNASLKPLATVVFQAQEIFVLTLSPLLMKTFTALTSIGITSGRSQSNELALILTLKSWLHGSDDTD